MINKSNSGIQNRQICKADSRRFLSAIERDVSDYAKKVNKRKPFYMARKEKFDMTTLIVVIAIIAIGFAPIVTYAIYEAGRHMDD